MGRGPTKAELERRIEELERELEARPEPGSEALVVAVQWRPGEAEAGVMVLSGGDPPMTLVAQALRQGEAMVLAQMERMALQAQNEAAQLRAQLNARDLEARGSN